jgi:hypothetical protein
MDDIWNNDKTIIDDCGDENLLYLTVTNRICSKELKSVLIKENFNFKWSYN